MNEIDFIVPESVPDAVSAIATENAVPLAGGTALVQAIKGQLLMPSRLVYLGRVPELTGIKLDSNGNIELGAMTTIREVADSELIRKRLPMLARAASSVGNPRVRAVATVGGALVHADPRQDLLPALIAAESCIHIRSPLGQRLALADGDFFQGFMHTTVEEHEMITHVTIPAGESREQVYLRFNATSDDDYPTVAVAARRTVGADGLSTLHMAFAGTAETPLGFTIPNVQWAETHSPEATITAATERACAGIDPPDDSHGSSRYKRELVRTLIRRTVIAMYNPIGS